MIEFVKDGKTMEFEKVVIGGGVSSVNGQTGEVWLNPEDIGALTPIQVQELITNSNIAKILDWSANSELNTDAEAKNKLILNELLNVGIDSTELYLKVNSFYYKAVSIEKATAYIIAVFEANNKQYTVSLYRGMPNCIYSSKDIHSTTFSKYDNANAATMAATAAYIEEQINNNLLIESEVTV